MIDQVLAPDLYLGNYATIFEGPAGWRSLSSAAGRRFSWNGASTFIRRPPHFDGVGAQPEPMRDFVNYAARRLNHDVMIRGTFANIQLRNEMTPDVEGSSTVHHPSAERMSISDAAERYRREGVPLVVVAGREYGAGSSRDWAAKGTRLLGVRAVIAESFERIHRSSLLGMGVLPLQFTNGATRATLRLDGSEAFDVAGVATMHTPRALCRGTITRADGRRETIELLARLDTRLELEYFRHGGIMNYVLRRRLAG